MGSSHAREHGPLNVVVECVSIVQDALPHGHDMAGGRAPTKQRILRDRITRQQAMIADRYKTDIWFCLYYCLLRATERHITGKDVSCDDIQNMFGVFQDHSEEQRSSCDLATQILMIVHHLLVLSRATAMTMAEKWQFHDSINVSIQSAQKRFCFLRYKVQKSHRHALEMLFRVLSGIYKSHPRESPDVQRKNDQTRPTARKHPEPNAENAQNTQSARRLTRSLSGCIVTPTEWSED